MGRVVLMNQADRPLGPYRDTRLSTATAGGFTGIGLGFGAILLLGVLNGKLERPDDAESQLQTIPLLGMVPTLPEDMSDPANAALTAHCVHEIRTLLQIMGQGQARPTFGITSPSAGSGKTSITLALGLSFAAANHRTLLIDCDIVGGGLTRKLEAIARRRIGTILLKAGLITQGQLEEGLRASTQARKPLGEVLVALGYITEQALASAVHVQSEEELGLLDALGGEDVQSCVAPTGIDGLYVMPLGSATVHDAASLSLASFRSLLDRCQRCFDVILVDTGPILGSLEASVVASQTDQGGDALDGREVDDAALDGGDAFCRDGLQQGPRA
jgi:Mrp family chromosome partitioning ATPase